VRSGLEQILDEGLKPPLNKRRAVGPRNPNRAAIQQAANEFLDDAEDSEAYELFRSLTGRGAAIELIEDLIP
jgi:hypothetical protein